MVLCLLLSSFPAVVLAEQPTDEEIAAGIAAPPDNVSATSNARAISSGATVSTQALTLSNGVYCLNNKDSGKYLRCISSLSLVNGYVSTYGNYVKWQITAVSGGYTISSVSSSTKYLGVPSSTSSNTVELVTVSSGASIPARCIWIFESADGFGCLVKNTYNSKYMYFYAGSLRTSTSTARPQSEEYLQYAWRVAKHSLVAANELTSCSIKDVQLYAGGQTNLSITRTPSSAYWATSTDFSYTGLNLSYSRIDAYTGRVTSISSLTTFYSTTVTATHKVTGIRTTFTLVINPKVILIGIPSVDEPHDHYTYMNNLEAYIDDTRYMTSNHHQGEMSVSGFEADLCSVEHAMLVIRSHGTRVNADGVHVGTALLLSAAAYNGTYYLSNTMSESLNLSNMELILFVGCLTGYKGATGPNLLTECVERGAETAIGFTTNIDCDLANEWVKDFVALLSDGKTVKNARDTLNQNAKYKNSSLANAKIAGNLNLTIN